MIVLNAIFLEILIGLFSRTAINLAPRFTNIPKGSPATWKLQFESPMLNPRNWSFPTMRSQQTI